MQINRDGFLFTTAYVFKKPEERPIGYVNGCNLLWRFVFCGLGVILITVVLTFGAVILGVITVLKALTVLPFGGRLVWTHPTIKAVSWESRWLEYILEPTWPGNWSVRPIKRLPSWLIWVVWGYLFVWFEMSTLFGTEQAWQEASSPIHILNDFWGFSFVVQVVVFSILGVISATIWSRENETGQLLRTYIKGLKDRTCPVVEIVY